MMTTRVLTYGEKYGSSTNLHCIDEDNGKDCDENFDMDDDNEDDDEEDDDDESDDNQDDDDENDDDEGVDRRGKRWHPGSPTNLLTPARYCLW